MFPFISCDPRITTFNFASEKGSWEDLSWRKLQHLNFKVALPTCIPYLWLLATASIIHLLSLPAFYFSNFFFIKQRYKSKHTDIFKAERKKHTDIFNSVWTVSYAASCLPLFCFLLFFSVSIKSSGICKPVSSFNIKLMLSIHRIIIISYHSPWFDLADLSPVLNF